MKKSHRTPLWIYEIDGHTVGNGHGEQQPRPVGGVPIGRRRLDVDIHTLRTMGHDPGAVNLFGVHHRIESTGVHDRLPARRGAIWRPFSEEPEVERLVAGSRAGDTGEKPRKEIQPLIDRIERYVRKGQHPRILRVSPVFIKDGQETTLPGSHHRSNFHYLMCSVP